MATIVVVAGCRLNFDARPDIDRGDALEMIDAADATLPVIPPSCVPAVISCGPAHDQDCCASPMVPGSLGTPFYRTYDASGDGMWNNMVQPATVSAFRLDRYEVTVARFRRFVAAGAGTQASPPAEGAGGRTLNSMSGQGGWRAEWTPSLPADRGALTALVSCDAFSAWTPTPGANDSRPIGCITFYVAMAFCIWDGGYLPTQTEYFYITAGDVEQRAYPWSQPASDLTVSCGHANSTGCASASQDVGLTSPLGDGRWGHADLAGNAWEWVVDKTVALDALPVPCDDCAALQPTAPAPTEDGSLRSGSYQNTVDNVRSSFASAFPLASVFNSVGIRCARPI